MPELTINARTVEVAEGCTILEAARAASVTIPTLCHHKDLSRSSQSVLPGDH